ncbi:phospholipase A and acyltransferase 2-like isoform X1 [Ursus americanus]|uniref:LRAT domain-containing protein n=1 Tax=Ursus americanus TaxID=9643 RepID=A0A452QJZ2_URSAM|nr:phospholipase A and acyltransferase 2-like isoform X1 [Ursus americanus]XP_045631831.1 phospholipase A and acyltransferase 2-like isoform X1 [Ursus americanus]XP_045631832.1 phospholipase A and acyltransferase 2-like isoform X1 [Ursus americanus]XP_045631833.1 phospholipase A and acyltransferase 2-like isoform X1 [Ursus americanus]
MASAKRGPKVGDLIEIFRPDFQHWAVYVGDGYVVHVTPSGERERAASGSTKSVPREKVVAKKELLDDVAGRDKYQLAEEDFAGQVTAVLLAAMLVIRIQQAGSQQKKPSVQWQPVSMEKCCLASRHGVWLIDFALFCDHGGLF